MKLPSRQDEGGYFLHRKYHVVLRKPLGITIANSSLFTLENFLKLTGQKCIGKPKDT